MKHEQRYLYKHLRTFWTSGGLNLSWIWNWHFILSSPTKQSSLVIPRIRTHMWLLQCLSVCQHADHVLFVLHTHIHLCNSHLVHAEFSSPLRKSLRRMQQSSFWWKWPVTRTCSSTQELCFQCSSLSFFFSNLFFLLSFSFSTLWPQNTNDFEVLLSAFPHN